jgi:hypothetical protein
MNTPALRFDSEVMKTHHAQLLAHIKKPVTDEWSKITSSNTWNYSIWNYQSQFSITRRNLDTPTRNSALEELRRDYPNGCGSLIATGYGLWKGEPTAGPWVEDMSPGHYFPFLGQD